MENDKDKISVLTIRILNGEHAGKILVSAKDSWKDRILHLQEQADKQGIPIKLTLENGQ